jgi:hypothetical protein
MAKAKAAASVDELVRSALLKAANANAEVKLSGKGEGLFPTLSGANKEAVAECLNAQTPLLSVTRMEGKGQFVVLAPAGFLRIAGELADGQVGVAAKGVASALPAGERIGFLQDVLRTTPLAAAELTPLLEEAVTAERVEHEARVASATKRRAAEQASLRALDRAKELIHQARQNRLDALKREWAAAGADPTNLEHEPRMKEIPAPVQPEPDRSGPEPTTGQEKDFRRDVAKQFAEVWRTAWKDNKQEGRDFLESAMWNVSGLKMIGEVGAELAFDGRYHDCAAPVFTGDRVRITRPGWLVEEGSSDFVAIKAVVEKV